MKACWKCGAPWLEKHTPGLRAECEKCFTPLHACANCRFYCPRARQWCGEPMARGEKPRDPEMANSCSFFLFADREEEPGASPRPAGEGPAVLFGGNPNKNGAEEKVADWMRFEKTGRDALDRMFKPPDRNKHPDGC